MTRFSLMKLPAVAILTVCFAIACDSDDDTRRLSNLITVAEQDFTSIAINGDTETVIETGQSTQLSLTAFRDNSTVGTAIGAASAEWRSSDRDIAEVDSDTGLVFGGGLDGEVTITASFGNLSATAQLRVSSAQLESIIIQAPEGALNECSSSQFEASGMFEGESELRDLTDSVEWSVAEGSAAFDNGTSLLRVTSAGELSVTATRVAFLDRAEVTQSAAVTVADGLTDIDIIPDAGELAVNSPLQYRAFPIYAAQPDLRPEITDNVIWSIEDVASSGGFAVVDNTLPGRGLVTPSRSGDGVLSANCAGTNVSQSIGISAAGSGDIASVVIEAENSVRDFPLQVVWLGDEITEQLVALAAFLDQEGSMDVTGDNDTEWSIVSSTNNVFTIDNDGNDQGELTIRGEGTVTVSVTFTDDDGTPFTDTAQIISSAP